MEIDQKLLNVLIKFAKSGRSTDYVCGASFGRDENRIKERRLFDDFINNIEGTKNYPYDRFEKNMNSNLKYTVKGEMPYTVGDKEIKTMDKNTEINGQNDSSNVYANYQGDTINPNFKFQETVRKEYNRDMQSHKVVSPEITWPKVVFPEVVDGVSERKEKKQCCGDIDKQRKYLPTLSELIDRLSITQLKELFLKDHRSEYAQEIQDIMYDIDLICKENNLAFDAKTIRAIIVTSQMNLHIWHNESNYRKFGSKNGTDLALTHGLNSQRNFAKNIIQELVGGRKDYKLDNVEAFPEWVPSWNGK
jgi:hypothetical protein